VKARYYQLGAEAARIEQSIQHARELRQRQRADLEQSAQDLNELNGQLGRDQAQVEGLLAELRSLEPQQVAARASEEISARGQADAEQAMQVWQGGWETFNRDVGEAQQRAEVERARIEEIDNRLRSLKGQAERAEQERSTLPGTQAVRQLELLVIASCSRGRRGPDSRRSSRRSSMRCRQCAKRSARPWRISTPRARRHRTRAGGWYRSRHYNARRWVRGRAGWSTG
jgi:chromosome segregation protein